MTSQRGTVTSVDPSAQSLTVTTPEGAELHMGRDDIGADKLAYGFAMTAHRSQGQTVDATYALEEGGGRELAYVSMSRARGESHVYVVAPDTASATARVAWAWGQERRHAWATDRQPAKTMAELYIERRQLLTSVPPDKSAALEDLRRQLASAEQDGRDLHQGSGRWAYTPAGDAARALGRAAEDYQEASRSLDRPGLGFWVRHKARANTQEASARFDRAMEAWNATGEPHARQVEAGRARLVSEVAQHEQAQRAREAFLAEHPDLPARVAEVDREIRRHEERERQLSWQRLLEQARSRAVWPSHDLGHDTALGIDL
ncbi:MAG: hypothetical protein ACRDZX_03750 [Acidimicrobiales bacterium]